MLKQSLRSNKESKRQRDSAFKDSSHITNRSLILQQQQRIKTNHLLLYITLTISLGFLTLIYNSTNGSQSDEIIEYILSSTASTASTAQTIHKGDETDADIVSYVDDVDSIYRGRGAINSNNFVSLNGKELKKPSSYLTMYGDHRVKQSLQSLPKWFQDYVKWNREITSYPYEENVTTTSTSSSPKYLILMCLPTDTCGGLSDRFRALAFNLFVASQTSRVLCIYWTRPYPLESFLKPNPSGIDWRCPKVLSTLVDESKSSRKQQKVKHHRWLKCHKIPIRECTEQGIQGIAKSDHPYMVTTFNGNSIEGINTMNRFVQRQSYKDFMPEIGQWSYPEMIGDMFRVMFQPVEKIAQRINATMDKLGLIENQYSSVHMRARYPVNHLVHLMNDLKKDSDTFENMDKVDKGEVRFQGYTKDYLVETLENAIKCGNLLSPDLPMLFVSDHHDVTKYALTNEFVGSQDNRTFRPIGVDIDAIPPHFDVKQKNVSDVAEYYSVFEDLLILGGSKCVTYGVGSYGSFGAGLAGNKCRTVHRKAKGVDAPCPNDRGDRKPIPIYANETLFGEMPGGEGKLPFRSHNE